MERGKKKVSRCEPGQVRICSNQGGREEFSPEFLLLPCLLFQWLLSTKERYFSHNQCGSRNVILILLFATVQIPSIQLQVQYPHSEGSSQTRQSPSLLPWYAGTILDYQAIMKNGEHLCTLHIPVQLSCLCSGKGHVS